MRLFASAPTSRPKGVLIVEDDPAVGQLFRRALGPGYAVALAPDLGSARASLAAEPVLPAVILLDIGLPDGDGLDLCRVLKALCPSIPIVLVSAHLPDAREAARSGADAALEKPVDLDELQAVVARFANA